MDSVLSGAGEGLNCPDLANCLFVEESAGAASTNDRGDLAFLQMVNNAFPIPLLNVLPCLHPHDLLLAAELVHLHLGILMQWWQPVTRPNTQVVTCHVRELRLAGDARDVRPHGFSKPLWRWHFEHGYLWFYWGTFRL